LKEDLYEEILNLYRFLYALTSTLFVILRDKMSDYEKDLFLKMREKLKKKIEILETKCR
jgi:hypothetical protein